MPEPDEFLDERQRRILAALGDSRSEVASFYRTALMLLAGKLEAPDRRTRVAFIGHCMREVMNRVLGSLGRPAAPKFSPWSGEQVKALPDLLARYPELELDGEGEGEGESVPVPREVAVAMDRLFKASVHEKRRIRDDVAALITDDDNASHAAVSRWLESREYFVKWAHLHDYDAAESDLPDDDEIRQHISVFDELLDGVITAFFTSRQAIHDLLDAINATDGELIPKHKAPTSERTRAALLRIPTYQLRRVFYEGLENPLWVRPLMKAGAFTSPPEPEPTGDGYIRDTYWPELAYLTRIAPQAPDEVVDVLLNLEGSNNGWVRRAVIEIASQIPADSSVRLEPLLKAWAKTGFGWRTDSHSLVSVSINLLEGGHPKLGRWLANTLFQPRAGEEAGGIRKPELFLEEYWYEEELPRIVPALGSNALKALVGWLTTYVQASGHASDEHDFSAMDRPSIDARGDATDRPEDALIEAVRDLAIPAMRVEPAETVVVLLRTGVKLLRKIAIYAVAEAIRRELDEGGRADKLLDAATQLLGDPASDDENLRVEYAQLARAAASADYSTTSVVTPFLAQAFEADLAWMRERLERPSGTTDEQFEESLYAKAERYRHTWLSAIGHDTLPAELREDLARLDDSHGVIEDPLEPTGRITTWTGPNPHTSQEDMAVMAPLELVIHLASWHDNGDRWGPGPSHGGQARALSGLLTTNPFALAGVPQLEKQLRPTYVRAILQGWEAALKADLELDWSHTADVIEGVLDHSLESPFLIEGRDFDDDQNYRGAKYAAVGLLEELLKKRGSVQVPDSYEQRFAELLIHNAADEAAWVEYDSYQRETAGADPLNMSLNWQWPARLRALIFAATRSESAPWRDDAFQALEHEVSRRDQHGAGRAVLGEGFGRLLTSAPNWLKTHLEALVGSASGISAEQQIVLTTAMATHRYNHPMYDLLTPSMLSAVAVGESLVAGWVGESKPLTRIGEWVIDALVFGHITPEDAVYHAFFTSASAQVRGDALGKVAWSFFHATKVDDSIRDRFGELWDNRIRHVRAHPEDSKELGGIYWLAKSDLFSADWWLPRLREAVELEPDIATERYTIGKELARASSSDPSTSLALLRLLHTAGGNGDRVAFDLSRHAIPVVIANAMTSGDSALAAQAEAYMNELGARGNLTLKDDVEAVLTGKLGVEDVDD